MDWENGSVIQTSKELIRKVVDRSFEIIGDIWNSGSWNEQSIGVRDVASVGRW